jgi:hypothetical protein
VATLVGVVPSASAAANLPRSHAPVLAAGRTITVNGTALCKGNLESRSPCASVTLSGNEYSDSATPNPQMGPDWGKFSFSGVPVANTGDFAEGTSNFTLTSDSESGPLNAVARHCVEQVSVQGALVPGDSFGLGWFNNGSGPWSFTGPCDKA